MKDKDISKMKSKQEIVQELTPKQIWESQPNVTRAASAPDKDGKMDAELKFSPNYHGNMPDSAKGVERKPEASLPHEVQHALDIMNGSQAGTDVYEYRGGAMENKYRAGHQLPQRDSIQSNVTGKWIKLPHYK